MRTLWRSLWREPRASGAPPVGRRDLLLLAAVPLVLLEAALRPDVTHRWAQAALLAAVVPGLLWRRTRPVPAVLAATIPTAAYVLVTREPLALGTSAVLLLLPYALARWASGREIVLGFAAFALHDVAIAVPGQPLADAAAGAVVLVALACAGGAMRFRERARERSLEHVRLLEREHLARDLHDTVAHHVSTIAVRAQVGQAVAGRSSEDAVAELAVIEREARDTLAEMRDLVRVLRRTDPDDASRPSASDLTRLAADGDGTSPPVRVAVESLDDVAAPVVAAVVRLAQESVTNARRHARHATGIDVAVRLDDDAVHLCVHDDGDRPAHAAAGRAGWGLVGMRERAALLGGTCDAGPDSHGGWTVTAILPRRWSP